MILNVSRSTFMYFTLKRQKIKKCPFFSFRAITSKVDSKPRKDGKDYLATFFFVRKSLELSFVEQKWIKYQIFLCESLPEKLIFHQEENKDWLSKKGWWSHWLAAWIYCNDCWFSCAKIPMMIWLRSIFPERGGARRCPTANRRPSTLSPAENFSA